MVPVGTFRILASLLVVASLGLPNPVSAQQRDFSAFFEQVFKRKPDELGDSVKDELTAGKWCLGDGCGEIDPGDETIEFTPDGRVLFDGREDARYEIKKDRIELSGKFSSFILRSDGKFYLPHHELLFIEMRRMPAKASPVRVFDVQDAPLLSEKGNLLGMRIHFSIEVPKTKYYDLEVRAEPTDDLYRLLVQKTRETKDTPPSSNWHPGIITQMTIARARMLAPKLDLKIGSGAGYQLDANTVYTFEMDFVPSFVGTRSGEMCVWSPLETSPDSPYFDTARTMAEPFAYDLTVGVYPQTVKQQSRNKLSLKSLADGISAEGIPSCAPDSEPRGIESSTKLPPLQ